MSKSHKRAKDKARRTTGETSTKGERGVEPPRSTPTPVTTVESSGGTTKERREVENEMGALSSVASGVSFRMQKTEPGYEPAPEPLPKPEPGYEPGPEYEPGPMPKPEPGNEPGPMPEPAPEPDYEPRREPMPAPVPEFEPEPGYEPGPEPEPTPEPDYEPDTRSEPELKSERPSIPPTAEFEPAPSSSVAVLRPGIPRMYVVQVTPELAPVAKVGGLGDVVFGL
jgi:hypothetical protein